MIVNYGSLKLKTNIKILKEPHKLKSEMNYKDEDSHCLMIIVEVVYAAKEIKCRDADVLRTSKDKNSIQE